MIEVNTQTLLRKFASLSPKQQDGIYRNALRKGANILVKETKQQLQASGIQGIRKTSKYGTSLYKGIKLKKKQSGKEVDVHIMGDYRLKFFEMGTTIRKKKSGTSTGKIRKYSFFATAKSNKEREIFDSMDKFIGDAIKKKFKQ